MSQEKEWVEYQILQGKVDKIGEFRFKVRGWTITVVSAVVIGSYNLEPPTTYLIFLPFLLILAFQLLEKNQDIWQNIFIRRILELEKMLCPGAKGTPRIARSVMLGASRARKVGGIEKLAYYANVNFYIIMYILFLLVVFGTIELKKLFPFPFLTVQENIPRSENLKGEFKFRKGRLPVKPNRSENVLPSK